MPQKLTLEIIIAAIAGFESQKLSIDGQIAELRQMLDGRGNSKSAPPTEAEAPTGQQRKFSAAVRRKMALAQRARYAKLKQGSEPNQTVTAKSKRKISAAGRRAMSEATKKRWALKRAEAARASPAVAKKAGHKMGQLRRRRRNP